MRDLLELHKDKITTIHLEGNFVTCLPIEFCHLPNLRELWIRRSCLLALPKEVADLPLLESLRVPDNNLKSLPREIGKMTSLKMLCINGNKLKSIPQEIENLDIPENMKHFWPQQDQQDPRKGYGPQATRREDIPTLELPTKDFSKVSLRLFKGLVHTTYPSLLPRSAESG
jgi:Leucine-rich repeat (LRR) protein